MGNNGDERFITELDQYLFGQGTHYDIFKKLGAHIMEVNGVQGVHFAVWAPNAAYVSVVGDFNMWNGYEGIMTRREPLGIFETFLPNAKIGDLYKFQITTRNGELLYKADPFANYAEMRPGTASRITDITNYNWGDKAWLAKRKEFDTRKSPMSIYEVHPGSWMKHPAKEGNIEGFYNYKELAHRLKDYVTEMGYTHVELMGIAEHPFDGSWGYQVTGYYAPTSRYGTPQDFMYFVDYMHKHNIGVILDWVPAHFPRDAHGLANFDGTPVFEYADSRKGEHPDWGTKIFDFGKNEVRNFLISNALFWIEQFHVDGLRVDAVASMLYLDYGKQSGQWVPNKYGGNKNLEAIEFFRHLNSVVKGRNEGVAMIAEESTAWPKVTADPEDDGLGFTHKWNMGWMHDFLDYMKLDPYFRKDNHNKMTFAMTYQTSENYINVISHDEVVHLKCAMVNKMPSQDKEEKYANLRAAYTFMYGHPGKKLIFMGQEFGQEREWSEERELDWALLGESKLNSGMKEYMKELLHLYRNYPAMYELDDTYDGFEWNDPDDSYHSVYSFMRKSKSGKNNLLFVCNFTPMRWEDYQIGVPKKKKFKLLLTSTDKKFGGSGTKKKENYIAVNKECKDKEYSFEYTLEPYEAAIFVF